jgi:ferredoxin-NADP reductase
LTGRLAWRVATLVESRAETAAARTLVLDVPDWPGHLAGQHADIRLTAPDGYSTQRSYSLAAPPDGDRLELTVQRVPDGEVSPYLTDVLSPGDPLEIRGPVGGWFVWRAADPDPVLLVAGGSGLAPIESILRALLDSGHGDRVMLYFGVRSERDLYHEPLLRDLASRHANFSYHVVLSEQKGARGRRYGLVHEAVDADLEEVEGLMSYLAGPPVMVEATTALLAARGLAPRQIHADAFYNQT